MELHDPEDERKTEHKWPETEPKVPPPPLLDVPSIWENVADAVRTPTAPDDINVSSAIDVPDQDAAIVARKLRFYLLAPNRVESTQPKSTEETLTT